VQAHLLSYENVITSEVLFNMQIVKMHVSKDLNDKKRLMIIIKNNNRFIFLYKISIFILPCRRTFDSWVCTLYMFHRLSTLDEKRAWYALRLGWYHRLNIYISIIYLHKPDATCAQVQHVQLDISLWEKLSFFAIIHIHHGWLKYVLV